MNQSIPTGNGECRGPEAAQDKGTPLPGTRPSRAAANNARNADFLGQTPVADQGGFGTEDMVRPANFLSTANVRWHDALDSNAVPDLASLGNGGEPFGEGPHCD
jgi:hypothetical protein